MTSLSVALVSRHGLIPASLSRVRTRLVREPHEICSCDDVVLFYGTGMARDLTRFSAEAADGLPPTLVLAPWLDWDDVSLALGQGAGGYLLENQHALPLDEALLCAAHGTSILDPAIAAERIRFAPRESAGERNRGDTRPEKATVPDPRTRLSPRERQLMDLLASGLSTGDVARKMYLTDKTVRNYLSRVYGKLAVRNRSEAILCWLGHPDTPPVGD
ncbi:helix-turn-helix domain-containing protein [Streptomyces sp. NPDC002643]